MSFLKTETTSRHPGGRRHTRRGAGAPREVRGSDRWRSRRRVYPRRDHHRQAASAALDAPTLAHDGGAARHGSRRGAARRPDVERSRRPPARVRPRPRAGVERPAVGRRRRRAGRVGATRSPLSTCAGTGAATSPTAGTTWRPWPTTSPWSIDALGWSRPAVVGQSWGGNVVVELVHRHPDAARLVVGVDGGTIDLRRRFPCWEDCARCLAPPLLAGTPRAELERRLREAHPDWPDESIDGVLASFRVLDDGTVEPWLTLDHHLQVLRGLWEHDPFDGSRRSPRPCSCCRPTTATPQRRPRRKPRWRGPWRRCPPAGCTGSGRRTTTSTRSTRSRWRRCCTTRVGPRVGRDAPPADDHGLRRDRADDDQGPPGGVRPPRAGRAERGAPRHAVRLPGQRRHHLGPGGGVLPPVRRPPSRGGAAAAHRHRRHGRPRAGLGADPRRGLVVHRSGQPVVRAPPVGGNAGARRAGRPPAAGRSRRGVGVLERGRARRWASPPCPSTRSTRSAPTPSGWTASTC